MSMCQTPMNFDEKWEILVLPSKLRFQPRSWKENFSPAIKIEKVQSLNYGQLADTNSPTYKIE